MRDTAGSAAAPAARCRNCRRGSFILNLPLALHITRSPRRRGRVTLAALSKEFGGKQPKRHDPRRNGGIYHSSIEEKLPARAWKRGQDTLLFITNKTKLVKCAAGSLNICCRFFEHLLCELLHTRLGARRYNALVKLIPFQREGLMGPRSFAKLTP